MAALSFSWDRRDDRKRVYKAMARTGFAQFAELPITDQQLVLALAQHLKRSQLLPGLPEA